MVVLAFCAVGLYVAISGPESGDSAGALLFGIGLGIAAQRYLFPHLAWLP